MIESLGIIEISKKLRDIRKIKKIKKYASSIVIIKEKESLHSGYL
jgi:hypothetical protein